MVIFFMLRKDCANPEIEEASRRLDEAIARVDELNRRVEVTLGMKGSVYGLRETREDKKYYLDNDEQGWFILAATPEGEEIWTQALPGRGDNGLKPVVVGGLEVRVLIKIREKRNGRNTESPVLLSYDAKNGDLVGIKCIQTI